MSQQEVGPGKSIARGTAISLKKNPLIHPDSKMAIHSFQHEAKKGLLLNEVLSNWETTDHHLERLAVHPLS